LSKIQYVSCCVRLSCLIFAMLFSVGFPGSHWFLFITIICTYKLFPESRMKYFPTFWPMSHINLFVFDDEIEMKNRSSIQTLTFVQTNQHHLYMKLNMPGTCNHPVSVRKNWLLVNFLSWLLNWLLTFETGTWKWHLAIFFESFFGSPLSKFYPTVLQVI
jgi:hypothetical protein